MPIHAIEYTGIDPKFPVVYATSDRSFDTGTWALTGTHEEICAELKIRGQALADVRIPLADLPEDDPEKTTDPATNVEFWDGTDLVTRHILVESVWWDGEKYCCSLRKVE